MKWLNSLFHTIEELVNRRLNIWSRLLILAGVLGLALSFLYPLWTISLDAPQYQDTLTVDIYSYQLQGGDEGRHLQEINTVNHYVGMNKIQESDFTEMIWMPFVIGFFILFGLRAVVLGQMSTVIDSLALFLYFSLFSLANFIYRLYTYGHDLDPSAPMEIDPFMPAVIGTTEIEQFTQYSYPGPASYLMVGFIVCLGFALLLSWNEGPYGSEVS